MRMSTMLTASTGLGIAIVGSPVLSLLYGSEYRGAALVLRILVTEVVLTGATLVLGQAFMALSRPGIVTALQVTGLLLVVPLMVILVPRYGIVGAGIALLLSTTARFVFVLASFRLFLKIPIPALLPNRDDLRYIARAVFRKIALFGEKPLAAAKEMEHEASVDDLRSSLLRHADGPLAARRWLGRIWIYHSSRAPRAIESTWRSRKWTCSGTAAPERQNPPDSSGETRESRRGG